MELRGVCRRMAAFHLHTQQVFSAILLPTPQETAERTAERLRENDPKHNTIYVAISDGQVVGYGAVRWLNGLTYHQSSVLKKIGSALLTKLQKDAIDRGSIRLWCINLRARDSYQRGYYKKSGREEKDIAIFFDILDH